MALKNPITQIAALVPVIALAMPLLMQPALTYAAGESEDSGTLTKSDEDKTLPGKKDDIKKEEKKKFVIKCLKGKIWDSTKKKCTAEEDTSSLDQDSIYTYGRYLARSEQYDDAIRVLKLAHDQSDPRVLNYLGYSNRKLGNMDEALGYYHAAISANPDFTLVREYLGEAYIQLGQLEKAREQLTQIQRICGNQTCREYAMLTKYMVDHQLR